MPVLPDKQDAPFGVHWHDYYCAGVIDIGDWPFAAALVTQLIEADLQPAVVDETAFDNFRYRVAYADGVSSSTTAISLQVGNLGQR